MKTLLFFLVLSAACLICGNDSAAVTPPVDSVKVCTLFVGQPLPPDTLVWGD